MELFFLGTGAGMPSKQRNVTSIALTLYDERGTFWMFDCGEGTQHQLLHSPLKLSKLEKLFITHLHGDHIYGIPGLLTSRSNQGGTTPLTVYGPEGLRSILETTLALSGARMIYPLEIVEIGAGIVFSDGQFTVSAGRLDHRIECFGYRVTERDLPGKLLADKLKALGIPAGPLYARIKNGEDIRVPDGRVLSAADFLGPVVRGRTVAVLGDTVYCPQAVELARGADLLVHEATFSDELGELAVKYGHSTAKAAACVAREAGVGRLVLTHISSRYQGEDADKLLKEALDVFANVWIAADFCTVPIPRTDADLRDV